MVRLGIISYKVVPQAMSSTSTIILFINLITLNCRNYMPKPTPTRMSTLHYPAAEINIIHKG